MADHTKCFLFFRADECVAIYAYVVLSGRTSVLSDLAVPFVFIPNISAEGSCVDRDAPVCGINDCIGCGNVDAL